MESIWPYYQLIRFLVGAGYGNLTVLEKSLMQHPEHVDPTCTLLTLTEEEALEAIRAATDADFALPSKYKFNSAFVIEGPSSDVVEKAGSAFNIEPEFFASHLRATTWEHYDRSLNL